MEVVQYSRTIPARRSMLLPRPEPAPERPRLGPLGAVVLTLWFALATGFLELTGELGRRLIYGNSIWLGRYQMNRHYLWMIPATSLLVFAACSPLVSLAAWLWPRRAVRLAGMLLSFLSALTLLLLFRKLAPIASAVLAAGIAAWLGPLLEARAARFRRLVAPSLVVFLVIGAGLTAYSFGRETWRERQALATRPAAPPGSPNVLLIVLDATRADALSPYGARRDTSPNLSELARTGVTFEHARSTAPWTLPSHASMFTGRWPHELNVSPSRALDRTYPTLAQCLRRKGYATAGFVANYAFCSSGYGLERGFAHYEDRPISLDDTLSCTGLGRRLMPVVEIVRDCWASRVSRSVRFNPVDPRYLTQHRNAEDIANGLLNWIPTQKGRPYFAFLNLYDAHAPYIAPEAWKKHFGAIPETRADLEILRQWEQDWHAWNPNRRTDVPCPPQHEFDLARDGYDDCIAYMDDQIGRILTVLRRQGELANTLVIVTSDHGEAFGEHGQYTHYSSLHRPEIDVPLIMSLPSHLPQGKRVAAPVSMRSLPATVVDLLGLGDHSPFPGRSMAHHWNPSTVSPSENEPAELILSELEELSLQSIMAGTKVYIHYADGVEQLFDIACDPNEDNDLMGYPGRRPEAAPFRNQLAQIAAARPAGSENAAKSVPTRISDED